MRVRGPLENSICMLFVCLLSDLSCIFSGWAIHVLLFLELPMRQCSKAEYSSRKRKPLLIGSLNQKNLQLTLLQVLQYGRNVHHHRFVVASCRWPCTATRHSIHTLRRPTRSCSAKAAWRHSVSPTCKQQGSCISSMSRREAYPQHHPGSWQVGGTAHSCCIAASWHYGICCSVADETETTEKSSYIVLFAEGGPTYG